MQVPRLLRTISPIDPPGNFQVTSPSGTMQTNSFRHSPLVQKEFSVLRTVCLKSGVLNLSIGRGSLRGGGGGGGSSENRPGGMDGRGVIRSRHGLENKRKGKSSFRSGCQSWRSSKMKLLIFTLAVPLHSILLHELFIFLFISSYISSDIWQWTWCVILQQKRRNCLLEVKPLKT